MSFNLKYADYSEYSRRWSVLRYLAEYFTDYTLSVTDKTATNFWFRNATGLMVRPLFIFEKMSGARLSGISGELGRLNRQNDYRLSVLWLEENLDGTDARGDVMLDVLNEELIRLLHETKIPFWDYSDTALPKRVNDRDFLLLYQRDARQSERADRDRNVLSLEWRVAL